MVEKTPVQQRIDIEQELLNRQLAWKDKLETIKNRKKDPLTIQKFCFRHGFWESDISRKMRGLQKSDVRYIDRVDKALAKELKKDCE